MLVTEKVIVATPAPVPITVTVVPEPTIVTMPDGLAVQVELYKPVVPGSPVTLKLAPTQMLAGTLGPIVGFGEGST
jgi:hypothetical protein